MIQPGIYEHYKGQRYQVLGIAEHTETAEAFVVYQALYGDQLLWVRPLSLFQETVVQDGKEVPRFRFLDEGEVK